MHLLCPVSNVPIDANFNLQWTLSAFLMRSAMCAGSPSCWWKYDVVDCDGRTKERVGMSVFYRKSVIGDSSESTSLWCKMLSPFPLLCELGSWPEDTARARSFITHTFRADVCRNGLWKKKVSKPLPLCHSPSHYNPIPKSCAIWISYITSRRHTQLSMWEQTLACWDYNLHKHGALSRLIGH